jgi:hypothetical protein
VTIATRPPQKIEGREFDALDLPCRVGTQTDGPSPITRKRANNVASGVGSWTIIGWNSAAGAAHCSRCAAGAIAVKCTASAAAPRPACGSCAPPAGATAPPRRDAPITPITSAPTALAAPRA